jgi:sortase (surface protein transpeptidase)
MRACLPVALITVLAVLTGASLTACAQPSVGGDPQATSQRSDSARVVGSFRSTRTYRQVALPVRLRIPAAEVDTGLQKLQRATNGTIKVPTRPGVAGWYAEGPRPGEPGPAVILGHVDSVSGPAVFYHLSEMRRGQRIHVDRADGTSIEFRVTRLTRVPKTRFPTDLVYAPSLAASLRLVTCGGVIDPATGHYRDNVIVFAAPA